MKSCSVYSERKPLLPLMEKKKEKRSSCEYKDTGKNAVISDVVWVVINSQKE